MMDYKVKLTLDMEKKRICIPKSTLSALENPQYVQLLVNTKKREIVIQGMNNNLLDAYKVNYARARCYELYSKSLIEKVCLHIPELNRGTVCKLTGAVCDRARLAVFPIDGMQNISGGEKHGTED